MNLKPNLAKKINYLIVIIIGSTFFAGTVATTIAWSPLSGDEVFLVFQTSGNYFEHPRKIWHDALYSSMGGWSQGRFVSPVMHLFGGFWAWSTTAISHIFGIDLLLAYGLIRILTIILVSTSITALTISIMPIKWSTNFKIYNSLFLTPIFGIFLVSNNSWDSFRIQPGAYSVGLAISIFLLVVVAISAKFEFLGSTKKATFLAAISGALLGSTYEITQLLGPTAITMYVRVLWLNFTDSNLDTIRLKIKRIFFAISFWILNLSFLFPFAVIRIQGLIKCRGGNICYSPSDVQPSGLNFMLVKNRILTGSPTFSWPKNFMHDASWFKHPTFWGSLVIFMILSIIFYFLLTKVFKNDLLTRQGLKFNTRDYALSLILIGIIASISLGVGASASKSFQQSGISRGVTSIDSLPQAFAYFFIVSGLIILLFGKLDFSTLIFRIARFILVGIIALALSLTFSANSAVSRSLVNNPGIYLQYRFAAEIRSPDLNDTGNNYRCELIMTKLNLYPAWEGHDRTLVLGLNENMMRAHKIMFCDKPEELLFINYGRS